MSYLLSICITSYKRINELKRCLKSVDSKYPDKIEIVVSEDCSSQKNEIEHLVQQFAENSPYHVIFNSNINNLGYDRNLKKLQTLASGEYIFYLSDDDVIIQGSLDKLIDFIEKSSHKYSLIFAPFWYAPVKDERRKHTGSFGIKPSEISAAKYIYDAILFSGLIFKKESIKELDAERFKNLNYFQVYMFLHVMNKKGAYYMDELMINSVSDGENAYGQVESSKVNDKKNNNLYLVNRDSVFSNLEFNKGLFKTIKLFDKDNNTHIFETFSKEYSLRSFGGLCRARKYGRNIFKQYWRKMHELEIKYSFVTNIYYIILLIFGAEIGEMIFNIPRYILRKIRGSK